MDIFVNAFYATQNLNCCYCTVANCNHASFRHLKPHCGYLILMFIIVPHISTC